MARRRNKKKQDETLVDLVEARDQAQSFVEKNQTAIFVGLIAFVLIVGGIVCIYLYVQSSTGSRKPGANAPGTIPV